MADAARPTPQAVLVPARTPWSLPILRQLPKLSELTLASAIGGGGGTGGGGSTVFGILLAVTALSGCMTDRALAPGESTPPEPLVSVTCEASVATTAVTCGGGPSAAGGLVMTGGQGTRILLSSSNVAFNSGTGSFTFDVTLQNLASQTLGFDGTTESGQYVFFLSGPVTVAGSGVTSVQNEDALGFFTGPAQPFFWYDGALLPQQVSSPRSWEFHLDPGVTGFVFTIMVAADIADLGGIHRWSAIDKLTQGAFLSAASQDANDMMAVGAGGRSSRWDGTLWRELVPVTTEQFTDVTTAGPDEYIAVGLSGFVYRSKANSWVEIHHSIYGDYEAVWAQSADSFTALGASHLTTCAAGSCTDEFVAGLGFPMRWISGTPDGSYRVAMAIDGKYVESTDGGATWSATLNAVDGRTDVYVAGMTVDPDGDIIISIDIDEPGLPMRVVRPVVGDTLYFSGLAGASGITSVGDDSLVVTYLDYNVFGTLLILTTAYDTDLDNTLLSSASHVDGTVRGVVPVDEDNTEFLLYGGMNQVLVRWTGSAFRNEQPAPSSGPVDLATIGDTLFLVNGGSDLWRIVGWRATKLPTGLGSVQVVGARGSILGNEVLVADAGSDIYRRNGSSWDYEYTMPEGNAVLDIAGYADDDTWYAVGPGGNVLVHTESGGWVEENTGNDDVLKRVWTCGTTTWVGSVEGLIYTYAAGVLAEDGGFTSVANGGPITAIDGSSCSDVWVANDNNWIYHWDGAAWNDMGTWAGANTPRSILSRANGEAYIGGDGASLGIAFAAAPQLKLFFTGGGDRSLQAMAMTADGTIYAAGPGFLARGIE